MVASYGRKVGWIGTGVPSLVGGRMVVGGMSGRMVGWATGKMDGQTGVKTDG